MIALVKAVAIELYKNEQTPDAVPVTLKTNALQAWSKTQAEAQSEALVVFTVS